MTDSSAATPLPAPRERYERLYGARIVDVRGHANEPLTVVVEFEHRGTDDDSGYLHVDVKDVHFGDDDA